MKKGINIKEKREIENKAKEFVKDLLETYGCQVSDGVNSDYDLIVIAPDHKTKSTLKVLTDSTSMVRNCIGVELSRMINGREVPVGISSNVAEYYIFKVKNEVYGIETPELLDMIGHKEYVDIQIHPDDKNTKVALFDKELLLDRCERIKS